MTILGSPMATRIRTTTAARFMRGRVPGSARAALVLAALLVASAPASAVVISVAGGTNTALGNGSHADLQGLEWLSLDVTSGVSRQDIENGAGNTLLADGWSAATRAQPETLVGSLWDGQYAGWSPGNRAGAAWFLDTFGTLLLNTGVGYDQFRESNFAFGREGDCTVDPTWGCGGTVRTIINLTDTVAAQLNPGATDVGTGVVNVFPTPFTGGWFREDRGLDAGLSPNNDLARDTKFHPIIGHLLVRAAVPEPPVAALLALGLAAAGLRRRSSGRRNGQAIASNCPHEP